MFYINPKKFEGCKATGRVNLDRAEKYGKFDKHRIEFLYPNGDCQRWAFKTEQDANNCLRAIDTMMEMINKIKVGMDSLVVRIKR